MLIPEFRLSRLCSFCIFHPVNNSQINQGDCHEHYLWLGIWTALATIVPQLHQEATAESINCDTGSTSLTLMMGPRDNVVAGSTNLKRMIGRRVCLG